MTSRARVLVVCAVLCAFAPSHREPLARVARQRRFRRARSVRIARSKAASIVTARAIVAHMDINSLSTPADGIVAPLVDVSAGAAESEYAGKAIAGAVVLGDAGVGRLWQMAVKACGAAGVISTAIAPCIRPADPARFTREEQKDVFQWGGTPCDAGARSFRFKAGWRTAQRMRERLRSGLASVRVRIASRFHEGPSRSLVAGIRGEKRPSRLRLSQPGVTLTILPRGGAVR